MKTRKILLVLAIILVVLAPIYGSLSSVLAAEGMLGYDIFLPYYQKEEYKFSVKDMVQWASDVGTGEGYETIPERFPTVPLQYEVDNQMLQNKTALRLLGDINNGEINDLDATDALPILYAVNAIDGQSAEFKIIDTIKENLSGVQYSDVTVIYTVDLPEITSAMVKKYSGEAGETIEGSHYEIYLKYDQNEGKQKVTKIYKGTGDNAKEISRDELEQEYDKYAKEILISGVLKDRNRIAGFGENTTRADRLQLYNKYYSQLDANSNATEEEKLEAFDFFESKLKTRQEMVFSARAVIEGNSNYKNWVYRLIAVPTGVCADEWVLVKVNSNFETSLDYDAIIDGNSVGYTGYSVQNQNGTCIPNYVGVKDADVTAIIRATTDDDIYKVDNIVVGETDGNGWYYYENGEKVVAKKYEFKDYDNLENFGIVPETEVHLTSKDSDDSSQNVSIKWNFRITNLTYQPEKIDKDTQKVRVEITTNLPMDEKQLPPGWNLVEGTNQHKIYIEIEKDNDYVKNVEVVCYGRKNDKDSRPVEVKWPLPDKFETDLSYTAKIDGKVVGGEIKSDGAYHPAYDGEKDADVTATIKSKTGQDIVAINGVDIKEKAEKDQWYYPNLEDKTIIAKDYPFDEYDNIEKHGNAVEKNLEVVSADGQKDHKDVNIEWDFRIIKQTMQPTQEDINDETQKVRVEITTNLPIDGREDQMPDGWAYTDDDEGKSHHRVYIEIEKDNNYDKDVTLIADGRPEDKDTTHVKVEWPLKIFATELNYTAIINNKNVGGTTKDGTFYPGFDKNDVKKDAEVTATITSKTKTDIVAVNDVALTEDGKANSQGWYYPDIKDKTVIAKVYPFETYNNKTANGKVTEKNIKLTSKEGLTDTKDVSIVWPFRIIEVAQDPEKIDENTKKVRVEITTNLPIDEAKIPDGWAFTNDDLGKSGHKVFKEFTKGQDYNKEVILKANGRDDTDKTNVKIAWPKEEKKPSIIPQTGGSIGGVVLGAIAIAGVAVVSFRKFRK